MATMMEKWQTMLTCNTDSTECLERMNEWDEHVFSFGGQILYHS